MKLGQLELVAGSVPLGVPEAELEARIERGSLRAAAECLGNGIQERVQEAGEGLQVLAAAGCAPTLAGGYGCKAFLCSHLFRA